MSLKTHLKRLRDADLTEEYGCLNTLQKTQWVINTQLLEVMTNLWEQGQGLGKLPAREDIALPPFPFPDKKDVKELTEGEMEVFRAWSRKRSHIYSENN